MYGTTAVAGQTNIAPCLFYYLGHDRLPPQDGGSDVREAQEAADKEKRVASVAHTHTWPSRDMMDHLSQRCEQAAFADASSAYTLRHARFPAVCAVRAQTRLMRLNTRSSQSPNDQRAVSMLRSIPNRPSIHPSIRHHCRPITAHLRYLIPSHPRTRFRLSVPLCCWEECLSRIYARAVSCHVSAICHRIYVQVRSRNACYSRPTNEPIYQYLCSTESTYFTTLHGKNRVTALWGISISPLSAAAGCKGSIQNLWKPGSVSISPGKISGEAGVVANPANATLRMDVLPNYSSSHSMPPHREIDISTPGMHIEFREGRQQVYVLYVLSIGLFSRRRVKYCLT
ncbi:hypothetical protein F5X97DRAFT_131005 [Nemania serpens]|nr:hypothetical protein F5X97DRAFT_131005 [Nemania serpens]